MPFDLSQRKRCFDKLLDGRLEMVEFGWRLIVLPDVLVLPKLILHPFPVRPLASFESILQRPEGRLLFFLSVLQFIYHVSFNIFKLP